MKKLCFVFFLTALMFGCTQERLVQQAADGVLTDVTFVATINDDGQSKATVDGDGLANSVNRCIMEVYYDNAFYDRQVTSVTDKHASFSMKLISQRQYTVVFWADCAGDGLTDKYYNTPDLKNISIKGDYVGNDDARDAFFSVGDDYFVEQAGSAFQATLKRPFAQINVITTDADYVRKAPELLPTKVQVNLKQVPTTFNAVAGEAGTLSDLTYSASVYNSAFEKRPAEDEKNVTLSMDYVFAADATSLVDIDFKAGRGDFGNSDVSYISHSFSSIPYRRNYRTNVKGALLTTTGDWSVAIDPVWAGELPKEIGLVGDIAELNTMLTGSAYGEYIISNPSDSDENAVTFTSNNNGQIIHFNFTGAAGSQNNEIRFVNSSESVTGPFAIYVTALSGTNLDFNLPNTSVYVNGTLYGSISAVTSKNTLVIGKGVTVNYLEVEKGGLEIHGTVTDVEITGEVGDVLVRECENLTQTVYDKLLPYADVDKGYGGKFNAGKGTIEKIKGEDDYVAQIGDHKYFTFAAAVDSVEAGQTIELIKNCEVDNRFTLDKQLALKAAGATVNLAGYTLTVVNDYSFVVAANDVTVTNGNIVAGANSQKTCGYNSYALALSAKDSDATVSGISIENVNFTGGVALGGDEDTDYAGGAVGTLSGCNLTSGDFAAVYAQHNSSVTILSGTYNATPAALANIGILYAESGSSITLKGGTYNSDPTQWVDEDYKVTKSGDVWVVTPLDPVAKIGSKNYSTFAKAFAAAIDNDTVELLADCSFSSTLTVEHNITIDLKNLTLAANVAGWAFNVANGKSFTVKNGKYIDGTSGQIWGGINSLANTGASRTAITVKDVDFGTFNTDNGAVIRIRGNADVSIDGITATTNNWFYSSQSSNGSTLIVKNSTITDTYGKGTATFSVYGKSALFDKVNVAGTETNQTNDGRQSIVEWYSDDADPENEMATFKECNFTSSGPGNIINNGGPATVVKCTAISTSSYSSNARAVGVCAEYIVNVYGGTYKSTSGDAIKVFSSGGFFNIYDTYESTTAPVVIDANIAFYADTKNAGEEIDHKGAINLFGENIQTKGQWATQHSARIFVDGGFHDVTVWYGSNANNFILSGGTYTMDPRTNNCFKIASGYEVVASGDYWKVQKTLPTYGNTGLKGIQVGTLIWAPVNCGYDATNYPFGKMYQWARCVGSGYYDGKSYTEAGKQTTYYGSNALQKEVKEPAADKKYQTIESKWWYAWAYTNNVTIDKWPNKSTDSGYIENIIDDPCPADWHVPTKAELKALVDLTCTVVTGVDASGLASGSMNGKLYGTAPNQVFMPFAGRVYASDNLSDPAKWRNGTSGDGYYWTSEATGTWGAHSYYMSKWTNEWDYDKYTDRSNLLSVRCVHD